MSPPPACAAFATLALGLQAAAAPLPEPADPRWEPVRFPSIARATHYEPLPGGGVEARATCSASARVLPLADVDLERTPVLRWRWRVDEPLHVPDERTRSGDDFAARVYVMFRFDPGQASWLERARRRLASALYGRELPGTALSFVWTSHEPPGTRWPNPYAPETRMIALVRGSAGGWREERVDLARAYRQAFGSAPPQPVGIGLMTDADDSCGRAVARYADFSLDPQAGDASSGPNGPAPAGLPQDAAEPR